MAHSSIYVFVVLSLVSNSVKYFTTAAEEKLNITIIRTQLYDSVTSKSLLFPPCCEILNAQSAMDSSCRCSQTNQGFHEGNLSCVNMERLGYEQGCYYVLEGGEETTQMKLLSRRLGIAKDDQDLSTKCKFNTSGILYNKYLDCSGRWTAITAKHITNLFNLTTRYQKKVYLQPKYSGPTSPNDGYNHLLGRLIKLEVQCQTGRTLNTHSTCVVVKTLGTTVCTTLKSRKPDKKTGCSFKSRKEFQKQISTEEESVSTMERTSGLTGVLAVVVEAVVLLFIITALIIVCAFRTQRRKQANKRKSGSPSYFRTETRPFESSTDVQPDYADPVDVLSRADDAGQSPAHVTEGAVRLESFSNPTYERGPDKQSIINTRGDAASLLRQDQVSKPQKRRHTQPPVSNIALRNASKKPFLVQATISEEEEGCQENLYDEVHNTRAQKANIRKTKFRYSDPFPSGQPSSLHQNSADKSPEPLHYYDKSVVHEGHKAAVHAKRLPPAGKNKPQEAALNTRRITKSPPQSLRYYEKTIAQEAQRQVLRNALDKQSKIREKNTNIHWNNATPPTVILSDGTYLSKNNPATTEEQRSSQIYDNVIDDNARRENVYATLCCENPENCTCDHDEGYGSPICGKPTARTRIDSLEV